MHIRSDISVVNYIGYSKRLFAGIIFVFKLFSFLPNSKLAESWTQSGLMYIPLRNSLLYYLNFTFT